MAKTITVQDNQSMLDVILSAHGTLEAGMEFCALNGVSISATPTEGTVYNVPDVSASIAADGAGILKLYAEYEIVPGTLDA